eukprot:6079962-Pleurochrysis_carterae.AAC.1
MLMYAPRQAESHTMRGVGGAKATTRAWPSLRARNRSETDLSDGGVGESRSVNCAATTGRAARCRSTSRSARRSVGRSVGR